MDYLKAIISLLPNLNDLSNTFNNQKLNLKIFLLCYRTIEQCNNNISNKLNENAPNNTLLEMEQQKTKLNYAEFLICSVKDKLWEEINTGHWENVSIEFRQSFTLTIFLKVLLNVLLLQQLDDDENKTTIKTISEEKIKNEYIPDLDYGLLMGYPIVKYETLLNDTINIFTNLLSTSVNHHDPNKHTNKLIYHIKKLHRPHSEFQIQNLTILKQPSMELFQKNHFQPGIPIIITNSITHWPAIEKWNTPQYLIDLAGDRTVPIEIGKHYLNDEWSQDTVKFKDFINSHILADHSDKIEYLAQHNLFDQIPALRNDIIIPDYCCVTTVNNIIEPNPDGECNNENDIDIKAWLGPKGTISPMHYDIKHNLLCQVFGYKKIILASPDDSEFLYPYTDAMLKNSSQIDAENLDYAKFPLTRNVKFYHFNLYTGEILYIPPKWWHYVRSLDKSFSVSFWWD